MSIASTMAALQAIHAGISGVVSAPTARPTNVTTARLPCVLLRPRALTMAADKRDGVNQSRAYEGVALVNTPQQGRGIAETLTAVHTLMDAFATRYATAISDNEEVDGALIIGYRDSGESDLIDYQGSLFEGFTFTVEVWQG